MSDFSPIAWRRKKTDGSTCTFSARPSPEMTLQGRSCSSASSEAFITSSAGWVGFIKVAAWLRGLVPQGCSSVLVTGVDLLVTRQMSGLLVKDSWPPAESQVSLPMEWVTSKHPSQCGEAKEGMPGGSGVEGQSGFKELGANLWVSYHWWWWGGVLFAVLFADLPLTWGRS